MLDFTVSDTMHFIFCPSFIHYTTGTGLTRESKKGFQFPTPHAWAIIHRFLPSIIQPGTNTWRIFIMQCNYQNQFFPEIFPQKPMSLSSAFYHSLQWPWADGKHLIGLSFVP